MPSPKTTSDKELRDGDVAMIEITSMPLEPILDRIIFVPFSKLRRID
jgi:hypothetical protein